MSAITHIFLHVLQTCIGPTASASEVTFPDISASCLGNFEEVVFSNVVSLGILCETPNDGIFYFYGDYAVECADAAHNFDYGGKISLFGDFSRYVCSESATFAVGSNSSQIIRNVTVGVEKAWIRNTDVCFDLVPVPVPTAPTVPVTSPPTTSPTITLATSPIMVIQASPTSLPSMGTVATTEAPRITPVVSTTIAPMGISSAVTTTNPVVSQESPTDDNDQPIVGIAIGSAVAGFALAAVLGVFAIFLMRNQNVRTSKPIKEIQSTESNTNDDFASQQSPTTPHDYYTSNSSVAALEQSSSPRQPVPLHQASSNNRNVKEVLEPSGLSC